jgi:predicted 3-demethylubiquinone-9 3-methyltransferase (glyoxalase superfamily)
MPAITPNLWFDTEAEEAAEFYCSVFPNSKVATVMRYGKDMPMPEGTVLTIEFELDGNRFIAINGGPQFPFTEAVSLMVDCKDQEEIDYYWDALTAGGGEPGPCGWLKDRYGLSWQVVPEKWDAMMHDADPARAERAMQAMMQMGKFDIAALEAAADGR